MKDNGYVDKFRQPRVELTVKGNRTSLRVAPVVDTGFDGHLCLPVATAIPLGLELNGQVPVELADGSKKRELTFQGTAIWQGREFDIDIFLTESADALLGSSMMQGQKLTIAYANHFVTIEPDIVTKPGKSKKRKSKK